MLKKSLFRHRYRDDQGGSYEDDGPTMLRIIFDKCNPTTKAGVNTLKSKLTKFTLKDYDDNVPEMLDSMQMIHNEIDHG